MAALQSCKICAVFPKMYGVSQEGYLIADQSVLSLRYVLAGAAG